jgi:hypothetical protein
MPISNPNIDPRFLSLDEAMKKGKHLADISQVSQTVVVTIIDHTVKFYVLLTAAYVELREKHYANDLAPVASILPNGKVEIYVKEFGRYANV